MGGIGGGPTGSSGRGVVVRVPSAHVWLGAITLVNHQVDGHFSLQTRYVPVAKVVTQLMNLRENVHMSDTS